MIIVAVRMEKEGKVELFEFLNKESAEKFAEEVRKDGFEVIIGTSDGVKPGPERWSKEDLN